MMDFPQSLARTLQPLPMRPRHAVATETAGERRQSYELPGFSMQQQEHDQWCWAAVAASLARFYEPATKWKEQCAVANAHLERSDCCGAAAAEACNVARIMEEVLQTVGLFRDWHIGPKPFDAICEAIDANRAIVCRIVWSGGGGHFVVITGYDRGGEAVIVHDPFFQRSVVPFTTFCNAYLGVGKWTDTSETAAPLRTATRRRAVGHR